MKKQCVVINAVAKVKIGSKNKELENEAGRCVLSQITVISELMDKGQRV